MLDLNIKMLLEKEYMNVEKNGYDIASRLRNFGISNYYKVVSAAYAAYLAKANQLEDLQSLLNYINTELPDEQQYFLKDQTSDVYWMSVIEISKVYTVETLLAVVLWMTNSMDGRKFGGESETPLSIVKLAYGLLKPENESIADFCSGTGVFLSYAAQMNKGSLYYGIEINTLAKELSEIRMSLLTDNHLIRQGSVFSMDADRTFDKIFSDSPWNVRSWKANSDEQTINEIEQIVPELKRATTADWHFIVNVMRHLKEEGKAVVTSSNGLTWNGGISKAIRERIVKLGWLEAVISLPANLYSTTSIPTSILVLSKKDNKGVRLIDASDMATVGRRQNELDDEAINEILELMTKNSANSKLVSIDEIATQDYAINPSRYLQKEVKVENGVPLGDLIVNITRGAQLKASELDELVSDKPTSYQYLMLANIQDGIISEDLPYLKELDKKQEKYCIKNNSLVISKNGAPVKVAVAYVEKGKQILANGNLYIIELDETKADPYYVKAYLESENGAIALSRVTVGATLPNIPVDGLKKVLIPNPDMDTQKKVAEKYLTKVDEIKVLKYRLQKATSDLRSIFEEG
ncbi:N-6 DNA methylase [Eshraghiella crossota]|nr:N-6 DNA methylase [Butyrivibrio crossotus]UWO50142.1 N-6 DNA methylase [Butyrivibrio crossotus]